MRLLPSLLLFVVMAVVVAACGGASKGDPPVDAGLARATASEVFPDAPRSAPLVPQDVFTACVAYASCYGGDRDDRIRASQACVTIAVLSAEQRSPVNILLTLDETVDVYVACVNQAAGDCARIKACQTNRASQFLCEDEGCYPSNGAYAGEVPQVTCAGSVATIRTARTITQRDCARAEARCDPTSITGCTDRHPSPCPESASLVNPGAWCDGAVLLSCRDHTIDALPWTTKRLTHSYRDCGHLGGTCDNPKSNSLNVCHYPVDDACKPTPNATTGNSTCTADGVLKGCVAGRAVQAAAPKICGVP